MKDYLKNKLEVGDRVVFITPGYRDYSTGVIERFTKHFAFVKMKVNNAYVNDEIRQKGHQLIKIIESK